MAFNQKVFYLRVILFWLSNVCTIVTYGCLSNVYTLSSSAYTWSNGKDDRFTKKNRWPEIFGTFRKDLNYFVRLVVSGQFSAVDYLRPNPSTPPPPSPPPLIQTGRGQGTGPRWWKAPSVLHFSSFQRTF